jgi:3'-phosphoadenosine 5'-phosphosulfate sulfotransferase (PAPS reductase)/FAD synthetase
MDDLLLFELDPVGVSPGDVDNELIGERLARIASYAAMAASSAIAQWAEGRPGREWIQDFRPGARFITSYGSLVTTSRFVSNGDDGDITFLAEDSDESGDRFARYRVFERVRMLADGSIVSVLGERLLPESLLPVAGEAKGPVKPGMVVSHSFGWVRIIGITGLWALVSRFPKSQDEEPDVCHLGALVGAGQPRWADDAVARASVAILPSDWPDIEHFTQMPEQVASELDGICAEHVATEATRIMGNGIKDIADLKALESLGRRFSALSDRFPLTHEALQPVHDLFHAEISDAEWEGAFEFDLDYGWRLNSRGAALHKLSGCFVEPNVDICCTNEAELLSWFRPSERGARVRAALENALKASAAAPKPPSELKAPQCEPMSLGCLRTLANELGGASLSEVEKEAIEDVRAVTETSSKAGRLKLVSLGVVLSKAASRVREEARPEIIGLLDKSPWAETDLSRARQLIAGLFLPECNRLRGIVEAHEASSIAQEVAPGWWVAVSPCGERHGAVSETGYHSQEVASPKAAVEAYLAGGGGRRPGHSLEAFGRLPIHLQQWVRDQQDRLDSNALSALRGPTAYAQACVTAVRSFTEALELLRVGVSTGAVAAGLSDLATRLREVREAPMHGDDADVCLGAGILLEKLSDRFGEDAVGSLPAEGHRSSRTMRARTRAKSVAGLKRTGERRIRNSPTRPISGRGRYLFSMPNRPILTTPELDALLAGGAPVAIGISGGKDSSVAALLVTRHLDAIGHPREKRLMINADLGIIEWADSARVCREIAELTHTELVIVSRAAGDMIDRWVQRWANVSDRYKALESVRLTLPFSTPALRFCTSEMKSAVIASELRRRYPGETIISVAGIRREESHGRSQTPIQKENPRLIGKRAGTSGFDWSPIADFTLQDVWAVHAEFGLPIHEAYRVFGSTRVSCSFCIMSSGPDLAASFSNPANHAAWEALSDLELTSAFSFQGNRWLSDLGADVGDDEFRQRLARAKAVSAARQAAEGRLGKELLYVSGWPTFVPSLEQAALVSEVRTAVCGLYGWESPYLSPQAVRDRYAELFLRRSGGSGEQPDDAQQELLVGI